MSAFFLFWVFVAASLLSPVPVVAGLAIGLVAATGRLKAAFAVFGAAMTVMAGVIYMSDPYQELVDAIYLFCVQFLALMAWLIFVVALVFTAGEMFSKREKVLDLHARIRALPK